MCILSAITRTWTNHRGQQVYLGYYTIVCMKHKPDNNETIARRELAEREKFETNIDTDYITRKKC